MTRSYDDLTPEAQAERDAFDDTYGGGNCSCHLSAPCGSCTHPGNPHNQECDDTAWLPAPIPEQQSHEWLLAKYYEDTETIFKLSNQLSELKRVHEIDFNNLNTLHKAHSTLKKLYDEGAKPLIEKLQKDLDDANEKLLAVASTTPSKLPNSEGVLMPEGLAYTHSLLNDADFFNLIDQCGGWPLGYEYVGFEHTEARKAGFCNSPYNTGYWTTLSNRDDYYLWKLSPNALHRIATAVKKRITFNLQLSDINMGNIEIANSRGYKSVLSEDKK